METARFLSEIAFSKDFGRQMRFICGPRQTGKTTLAKAFLSRQKCDLLYYNWDIRTTKDRYIEDNHFFSQDIYNVNSKSNSKWICMDEIHKYPAWKNVLKDFFDSFGNDHQFIVTGSARLDMFRKSGDSLAGRYFLFHLNPLSLREVVGKREHPDLPDNADELINTLLGSALYHENAIESLLTFSGFPEPFHQATTRFHRKWQTAYIDRLIREDLRDLTEIKELENIAILMQLLPERIGAPLSINSLARDLKTSFATASRYINALELGYLLFKVPPYSKKIARAITKEQKVYFFDWTRVQEKGKRFENYVAVELKTLIELWADDGLGEFELNFIRDRDGKETDFLILRDKKPWLLVECKSSRSPIAYHHKKTKQLMGENVPFIQLVMQTNIAENPEPGIYQMSASRFFA